MICYYCVHVCENESIHIERAIDQNCNIVCELDIWIYGWADVGFKLMI